MQFNPKTHKPLIVIAGIALVLLGGRYAASHGYLPSNIGKIVAPAHYDLPNVADAAIPNVKPIAYPSSKPCTVAGPTIRLGVWEWNAQSSILLANGGAQTTCGSLMQKNGVNLFIYRQDDTNKMIQDLIVCAKQHSDGAESCTSGADIIVIMGDQFFEVAAQAQPQLLKLGADYGLKGFAGLGYSRGEDACMLPANVKENPHSLAQSPSDPTDLDSKPQGLLVAMSPREGDMNICNKWLGDNGLSFNPDPTTFDASAMNIFEEQDYNTAAADYVAGKCDDRKEVKNGKLTGNKIKVCINGVATWTPGDVTVARQRGGLVKVASSEEYRGQMPSLVVGSWHFINTHRAQFKGMLSAAFDAANQMKAFPDALKRAMEISTKVYGDDGGDPKFHGGEYWLHYFHPVEEKDKTGHIVRLGGSAVNNLADNEILFGFDGNNNNMAADYNIFRAIDIQQYPNIYRDTASLPQAKDVLDRSFIRELEDDAANGDQPQAQPDTVNYAKVGSNDVVSHRSYSINFAIGSAQPLPDGEATLRGLLDSVAITGLKVKVDGYTDDTGSAATNTALSQARANEVKTWLQEHAKRNFPDARFVSVEGHGPDDPVASNLTAKGKAQNRRVEISLLD